MKTNWSHLEQGRIREGEFESPTGAPYGAFLIKRKEDGARILIIADSGEITGWEHVSVSVSRKHRDKPQYEMPGWNLMCMVKDMFWEAEETVIQIHPPKADYINVHPFCLHLWKSKRQEYLLPPTELIGPSQNPSGSVPLPE
jgi:hypothetical protein